MRRTEDLAYENRELYPRPPALPPLLSASDYRAGFLAQTRLHPRLASAVFKASGIANFLQDCSTNPAYFDEILRTTDARFAPFSLLTLNATLLLADDPECTDPIDRAAALLLAACSFREDLLSGTLKADSYRGQPLEMGQYPNLFGTCLYPQGTCTRVFKSQETRTVMVVTRGHFFPLELGTDATLTFSEVRAALANILHQAESLQPGRAGLITCGNLVERLRAIREARRSKSNQAAFARLANALFFVCLDLETAPISRAETAAAIQRGSVNRWHFSSLQIVVNAKAQAGIITSFPCGLDGNVMGRFASEIRDRSARIPKRRAHLGAPTPSAPLVLQIPETSLARCAERVRSTVHDACGVWELRDFGRHRFDNAGLNADATFNLALLMTVQRLLGVRPQVLEHTSLSRYRNMGVEMARITSPEAERFVKFVAQPNHDPKRARELLKLAITAHRACLQQTRSRISLKWLSMLNVRMCQGLRSIPAWLLALSIAGKPDVIVSHPAPSSDIPCVGRPGIRIPYVKYFGLHYQIHADRIGLVLMPSPTWQFSERVFFAALETSLHQILSLGDGDVRPREPAFSRYFARERREQPSL